MAADMSMDSGRNSDSSEHDRQNHSNLSSENSASIDEKISKFRISQLEKKLRATRLKLKSKDIEYDQKTEEFEQAMRESRSILQKEKLLKDYAEKRISKRRVDKFERRRYIVMNGMDVDEAQLGLVDTIEELHEDLDSASARRERDNEEMEKLGDRIAQRRGDNSKLRKANKRLQEKNAKLQEKLTALEAELACM